MDLKSDVERELFYSLTDLSSARTSKAEPGCVLELEQIKLAFVWRPPAG